MDLKRSVNMNSGCAGAYPMRDNHRYRSKRGYSSRLYNLAWARAVQSKSMDNVKIRKNTAVDERKKTSPPHAFSSGRDYNAEIECVVVGRVVEEGGCGRDGKVDNNDGVRDDELEEGEIDSSSDSETAEKLMQGLEEEDKFSSDVNEGHVSDLDCENVFETMVKSVDKTLQEFTGSVSEKTFVEVCSRIEVILEGLWGAISSLDDDVVGRTFSSIEKVNSVFCSMNQNQKQQCQEVLSSLLICALSQTPSLFSTDQVKEDFGNEPAKIKMKPRDPRRILQNGTMKFGTTGSEQIVTSVCSGTNPGGNDTILSHEKIAPDITHQFTNNLKNIADLISLTPISTPVVSQIPSMLSAKVSTDRIGKKLGILDADETKSGVVWTPDDAHVGSVPPQHRGWEDMEHLLEGYDEQQKAAIHKERARRMDEQKRMFSARKLCLVLDLDHTLLNSAKFCEVDPVHNEILRRKEELDREKHRRHLFRFPHMGMWTKLRPGIWNFLVKASKLYELHLYTMGNKPYATEMARILDPKGVLFSGRVISRGDDGDALDGDERTPKNKDLEGVLGMESAVVIIDDSVRVWPHNKLNLIVVERYTYFPCSRRQFGLPGPSLLEIDHDERPEEGTLASSLSVIEKIHRTFFSQPSLDDVDVRNILGSEQKRILSGCRVVFSRIFPVGEANPHMHPLWQTAEQFGATCTNQIDEQVTHVVANSLGTDKVNWALSTGRWVVHPGWVEASSLLYRRANEKDFAVKS